MLVYIDKAEVKYEARNFTFAVTSTSMIQQEITGTGGPLPLIDNANSSSGYLNS